jgi:nucleoid DNA-binding protein
LNLSEAIKELILLNEVVILPGFGGFVSKYHPAEIRRNSNVFEPPSKEIRFDSRMINDNGLLVSHIAKKNNLPQEEALSIVNESIETLKKELQEKGLILIEGVGKITKSTSGSHLFEPVPNENYLVQSFGLPSVEIPTSKKPLELPKRPVRPEVLSPVVQKRKRFPVAALILALVLVAAGVLYFSGLFDRYMRPLFLTADTVNSGSINQEDKIVFGKQVIDDTDTLKIEVGRQLDERSSKEKALYYQEKAETGPEQSVSNTIEEKGAPVIVPILSENGPFHIIAGSFTIENNALRQKEILQRKGFAPRIIQKRGKYFYVSLQSFDSKETAMAEMRRIGNELELPLWVMEK